MPVSLELVVLLVGLAIWCSLYALILHWIRPWYNRHNLTALTVILGNLWIIAAMFIAAAIGIIPPRAAVLLFLFNAAAGTPILIWQFWDYSIRKNKSIVRNGNTEDGTEN
jgi:hypothetical protein